MHILCIFPGTIDNMIVHLNLPLGGKSPYKWQNNVVGSLRCSTEEKAGLRAWSRGRESGKRGRVRVYGKRESVQARESVWRGREGGKRKSVSASLLTAPGLRDSSSPRFPRCRFNSIPSVRSSFFLFFFLCLLYVLLLTALFPHLFLHGRIEHFIYLPKRRLGSLRGHFCKGRW